MHFSSRDGLVLVKCCVRFLFLLRRAVAHSPQGCKAGAAFYSVVMSDFLSYCGNYWLLHNGRNAQAIGKLRNTQTKLKYRTRQETDIKQEIHQQNG